MVRIRRSYLFERLTWLSTLAISRERTALCTRATPNHRASIVAPTIGDEGVRRSAEQEVRDAFARQRPTALLAPFDGLLDTEAAARWFVDPFRLKGHRMGRPGVPEARVQFDAYYVLTMYV